MGKHKVNNPLAAIDSQLVDIGTDLSDMLKGQCLLKADTILDDLRRLAWTATFSGCSMKSADIGPCDDLARVHMAPLLDGFNCWQIHEAIFVARMLIWAGGYQNTKNSRFGQSVAWGRDLYGNSDRPN